MIRKSLLKPTQNLNILEIVPLISPKALKEEIPASNASNRTIIRSREVIKNILSKKDKRILAIVGPCSIHDPDAALEYATRLKRLSKQVKDKFYVVMRVYFEKPRTVVGWKGLIVDPNLDGSGDIAVGLRKARRLLLTITEMGLPTGTEFLEPIVPPYISDLISWATIGARTTESQTHREMASGLSMPVGFKNNTDGNLQIAIDAMLSAKHPHSFIGIDEKGQTSVIKTKGNPWVHIILRGGRSGTNYDAKSIAKAKELLTKKGLDSVIVVDCSHANSGKQFEKQEIVFKDIIHQRKNGNTSIVGFMLESNLYEGNQKIPENLADLRYGVSITDQCISWETTEKMFAYAYDLLPPVA